VATKVFGEVDGEILHEAHRHTYQRTGRRSLEDVVSRSLSEEEALRRDEEESEQPNEDKTERMRCSIQRYSLIVIVAVCFVCLQALCL